MYQVKPYEGICALLEELKRLSVRIAVLSNKPDRDSLRVVEALFGKGYFDFVQGQRADIPGNRIPPAFTASWKPSACLPETFSMWGTAAWT